MIKVTVEFDDGNKHLLEITEERAALVLTDSPGGQSVRLVTQAPKDTATSPVTAKPARQRKAKGRRTAKPAISKVDVQGDLFQIPTTVLAARPRNSLIRQDITTIAQLIELEHSDPKGIASVFDVSPASRKQVRAWLRKQGVNGLDAQE